MHIKIGKINKTLAFESVDRFFWVNMIAGFSDELIYLISSIMIAHMVTPRALAGVNIVKPLYYFAMFFAVMIGKATALSVQTALGRFTKKEAGSCLAIGIQYSVIAGIVILFTILLGSDIYFESVGASQQTIEYARRYLLFAQFGFMLMPICRTLSEYISDSSNIGIILSSRAVLLITCTALSYFLCRKMGLVGIGLSYFIGYIGSIIVLLSHFMTDHNSVRPIYRKMEKNYLHVLRRCMPGGVSQLSGLLATICINAIVIRFFGEAADDALAFVSVISNINLVSALFVAIPETCCSHISLYCVENNDVTINQLIKHSLKVSSVIAIVLSAIIFVFAGSVPVLFKLTDHEQIKELVIGIRMFASFFIVRSVYMNYSAFQMALGHNAFSALTTFMKELVSQVFLVYVLSKSFGITGLFVAISAYPLLSFLLVLGGVKLYTMNTDKYTFPWLFSNTNVDPMVYDMKTTMENVIRLRDLIGEYLRKHGVANDNALRAELIVEEFGTLLCNNNDKTVLSEWDVYIYDRVVEIVIRDDGKLIDFSNDDATKGLSVYVLSCLMPAYGDMHYAKAISTNRHRFQISRR